jgi:hypothetical protein
MSDFIKHDQLKSRVDLIPTDVLMSVGDVLAYGANKYDTNNWLKGTNWLRYFGACLRHLYAWATGESVDKESGLPHLSHALCCLFFLSAYEMRGIGEDDRQKTKEGEYPLKEVDVGNIKMCPTCSMRYHVNGCPFFFDCPSNGFLNWTDK